MKKFIFTLATLRKSRQMQEQEQQRALAMIKDRLDHLTYSRSQMQIAIDQMLAQRDTHLRNGAQPLELQRYLQYYSQMAEQFDQLEVQIRQTEADREKCRERLVALLSEIKGLDKLEQKQWMDYQAEQVRQEEVELNDLVSFRFNPLVGGRVT